MNIRIITLFIATVVSIAFRAYAFSYEEFGYKILSEDDRTVAVTSTPHEGVIDIPQKIIHQNKTYTVTTISEGAFKNVHITQLNIPKSIVSISGFDFGYEITAINVNEDNPQYSSMAGVLYSKDKSTLLRYPQNNESEIFEIPASVTTIGNRAFSNCSSLSHIEIPNSVTTIGDDAFYGCSSLSQIEIPNSVTTIGSYAFAGCSSLSHIEIPNSVTTIGDNAFWCCSSLSQIEIPNSVTTIGDEAFCGCSSLSQIEIPNSVTTIGRAAFFNCSSLSQIEIPNSVTTIGDNAFWCCSSLSQIEIPNSVTTIGDEAFCGCSSLSQIEIPNSVTTIGDDAFYGCSSLSKIEIPNSVTTIGANAFYKCNALKSINCMINIPFECNPSFPDEVLKNAILYIPKGTLSAYEKVDPWRNFWNIEEMDFSGIEDVNSGTNPSVTVNNGTIVVDGYEGEVEVFNASGQLIYKGNDTCISNLNKGIYIVKMGTTVTKIAI